MRKPSAISMQRAMAVFLILTAVFFAQMLWWIIFQVRNSESTKGYLISTIEDERRWALELINSHYKDLYHLAQESFAIKADSGTVRILLDDPAVSGTLFLADQAIPVFNDSLYFNIAGSSGNLVVFLNRNYPGRMLSGNSKLIYRSAASGPLARPDWLNENNILPNPAILDTLELQKNKHLRMFIMEGLFFLLLVGIGAWMIYKALKRIKEVREEQLLFIHSITHELKIPITSINLFLDTMRRRSYETKIVSELAPKMKEDLARLNHLIDNILQIRKLSDRQGEIRSEIIDLSTELKRYVNLIAEKIESAGGRLNLNIEENLRIQANLSELVKIWESIIDNSLKYGRSGNLILTINLFSIKNEAEMQFIDNGSGIPEGMEEKLFQPFFRGNIENKIITPGSGLGLYIAREFARRYKGRIAIANVPSGGCKISIRFKRLV
jgi:signal transduction histidine kinase